MIVLIDLIDLKLINRKNKRQLMISIDKSFEGELIASSYVGICLLNTN